MSLLNRLPQCTRTLRLKDCTRESIWEELWCWKEGKLTRSELLLSVLEVQVPDPNCRARLSETTNSGPRNFGPNKIRNSKNSKFVELVITRCDI